MNQPIEISAVKAREASFFAQVYQWMAIGLGVTAASAFLLLANPSILMTIVQNPILFYGLMFVELGLVWWLSARITSMTQGKAIGIFCTYSALNGIVFALIFIAYTGASIVSTFAITAGTFIVFSVYGHTTKRDLTSMSGLITMALIGFIIASVVNMFLRSAAFEWMLTYVGIALFIAIIAWKTNYLKQMHAQGHASGEMEGKMAIWGALGLYIAMINLFILLLRIFGDRR